MKKILFIICILAMAASASAQRLGVKAGATYATFKGDDARDYDYRLGYSAGLFLQQHITTNVGVQAEALYTSRGAKNEYRSAGNSITDVYRLNYVDVPVLLHLSSSGFFLDLGPQISFMNKARRVRDIEPDGSNSTTTVKTDISDDPYSIDFSYVAGLGYRAPNNLGIELRYTGGLKKIDDEGPLVGRERRNSTISLMLSYLLPTGE